MRKFKLSRSEQISVLMGCGLAAEKVIERSVTSQNIEFTGYDDATDGSLVVLCENAPKSLFVRWEEVHK